VGAGLYGPGCVVQVRLYEEITPPVLTKRSVSLVDAAAPVSGGLHTIVMLCVDGLTRLLIGMLDVIANQLDANVVDTFNMP
jgi:hypothetical protein